VAIDAEPSAWRFASRGDAWYGIGEMRKAIADYGEAIKLDANSPATYLRRGNASLADGQTDSAVADFTEAIGIDPELTDAYINRAKLREDLGEFDKALEDYAEAVRLKPDNPEPYNFRAWIWATCSNPKYRDGKQAVDSATKACELTKWNDAKVIDTLASAYAETGNFEKAIEWQTRALEMMKAQKTPDEDLTEYQDRLVLFKSGTAYRDEPKK